MQCSSYAKRPSYAMHLCSKTTPNARSETNLHLCSRFNCISTITMPLIHAAGRLEFMQQVCLHLCSRFACIYADVFLACMQQIYVHLCRRSSGMYTADLLAFMQTFVWHVCSRFTCIYAADIQSTIRLPHIYAGSLPIFEMRLPGPIL